MPRIEIKDLSVNFGGVQALRGVSLAAATGEIVGLIGPNGAGKSTLLNCLSGITRPSSGRGFLDGTDLFALPPHRIAALGIGRVFQQPELVADFTVLDNLLVACHRAFGYDLVSEMLALPRARRREEAARDVADKVLDRLGLRDTKAIRVGSLPYGHRKLIELGRAVVSGAKFLLLDEPVAGLNDAEIDRLARLVLDLRDELGLGVILVEHNMGLVRRICDRVVVLDVGAVIASGTPETALRDPKVLTAYLGETA
jgi:branched-chain amino acid transport system ATP-binding protein